MKLTLTEGQTSDRFVIAAGSRVSSTCPLYWARTEKDQFSLWPSGSSGRSDTLLPLVAYAIGPGTVTVSPGEGIDHDQNFYWTTQSSGVEPNNITPLDPSETEDVRAALQAGIGDMAKSEYDSDNNGIVDRAETVRFGAYFQGAVNKGDPVYVTGTTGANVQVNKSQASQPSTMPSCGVAAESYGGGETGEVVAYGVIEGMATGSYSLNDILYVGPTGGLTKTRYATAQQAVGVVTRTGGNDGTIGINVQSPGPFVYGHRVTADNIAASTALTSSPAVYVWPNLRTSSTDLHYDTSTGVFTFRADGYYTSVANFTHVGTAGKSFYTDAEFSTDGITWTRGTNSGRRDRCDNTGKTASFAFAGFFTKGTRLRFMVWATDSSVTLETASNNGSTFPAARITSTFIPGAVLEDLT